jgi:hypothetical protein
MPIKKESQASSKKKGSRASSSKKPKAVKVLKRSAALKVQKVPLSKGAKTKEVGRPTRSVTLKAQEVPLSKKTKKPIGIKLPKRSAALKVQRATPPLKRIKKTKEETKRLGALKGRKAPHQLALQKKIQTAEGRQREMLKTQVRNG